MRILRNCKAQEIIEKINKNKECALKDKENNEELAKQLEFYAE